MDGLEAVEIRSSDVMKDNDSLRLDSEFFKKDFYLVQDAIQKHSHEKLGELTTWITQGPNPIFIEDGIPSLNGRNIAGGKVEFDNSNHISEEEYQSLARFQVKENDVLLTLKGKGSVGKIGFVFDAKQGIFSRDIGLIRVNPNKIESAYLHVFLNSKYGKLLIERGETGGTGQTTLTTSYLKKLQIPRLTIETKIGEMLHLCERLYASSQTIYEEAENVLLEHLGLKDWQPSEAGVSVKSFADSFGTSARLDAEHYQPKYDELLGKLGSLESVSLGNLVSIKKSFEPGSEAYHVPFIRIADLTKFGITSPDIHVSENVIDNLEALKLKKDTVLLTKDGSIGIAYKVPEDLNAVTSGGILHLTVRNQKVLPDYLALVLNSVVTKLQAERDAGGSIIQHWKPSEIAEVLIPILDEDVQEKIVENVHKSFDAREKSERLLEAAKRGVELAIEESETAALAWIEEQLSSLGLNNHASG